MGSTGRMEAWTQKSSCGLVFLVAAFLFGNTSGCEEPLGIKDVLIPDHQIHASSWTPDQSDPWYGRLGNQTKKSWCAATLDANQYLQIDFGPKPRRFTAVSTQGSHSSDGWVTTYTLSYSDNGTVWDVYKEGGVKKVFTANADRHSIVKHSLLEPFDGLFVRFHPKTWDGEICMRVEAFGCSASYQPLGLESGKIPNGHMRCLKTHSYNHCHYGRLNHNIGARMDTTFLEFMEVNIGPSLKAITAVATQGHATRDEWVKMYSLAYSPDGAEWFDYKEHDELKMFDGNFDRHTIVKHELHREITAIMIRFNVFTLKGYAGIRVEIYGSEVCNSQLGMENNVIPDNQITASSFAGPGKEAIKGRVNGTAAWCGVSNLDFLQIDLGKVYKIVKVATQGHPSVAQWVTKFAFHYSLDNIYWYLYQQSFHVTELNGNTDQNTVVSNYLNKVRQARYVRFQPKTWSGGPCMRVELFGCQDCMEPLGLEIGHIPDSSMSSSSLYDVDHEPWLGRLYETRGEKAWCAKTNDGNQFLQVDLGHMTRVTGVATQGKYVRSWWAIKEPAWVTAYKMSYSNDTFTWTFYKENSNEHKMFSGNSASASNVKHNLAKELVTRHIRFIPTQWETWTCMRVEVYGCKACDSPLGMEFFHIRDEAILGSSGHDMRGIHYRAHAARLHHDQYYGWAPNYQVENPYLQIDLGGVRVKVTAVATQGDKDYRQVLKLKLSFSNDRLYWFDYRDEWQTKIFEANKSKYIATKNYLDYPVTARYVQFWPKEWTKHPGLRVEVYGKRGQSHSLLMSDKAKVFSVTSTSIVTWTKRMRLNDVNPDNTWCSEAGKFLRLDFGSVKEVRTIFMQGHPTEEKWVKKFMLRYSDDGIFYTNFTTYWEIKELTGNEQRLDITKFDVDPRVAARFVEIRPVEWNTAACMRIEVYGDDDCIEPLGMENHLIPDEDIKATSWMTVDQSPSQARLYNIYGEGAWCPRISNTEQYLEITLQVLHRITGIGTQGRYPLPDCLSGDYWVTQYSLEYTVNGYKWQDYQQDNKKKVLTGNQDYLNVAVNYLNQPITAKGLRIRPVQWNQGICMRVEIYGCKERFFPVGLEDYRIPTHFIRYHRTRIRLNSPFLPKRIFSDYLSDMYLTISLGAIPFKLTGVAKQCRNNLRECVTKYSLSFSLNDGEWFYYIEDGKQKVFKDSYYDFAGVKLNHFKYELKARNVRFWRVANFDNPCLRVELYGYKVDNSALGLSTGTIPDSAITASSQETKFEAINARLDSTFTKAWCAATPIQNEFLKIDLGRITIVSQVAIGRLINGKGRVYEFWMSFSVDGKIWEVYNEDESGRKIFKTFQQNMNTNEAHYHVMRFPFRARFVKVRPSSFNGDAPCLTLELYGKEDCHDELGVADWRVQNSAMTASSSINNNYLPWMGRVGNNDLGGAWCARYNDVNQFLQVDLGSQHKISSVLIQGKEKITEKLPEAWVKSFSLSSSRDGYNWTDVKQTTSVKVFEGNINKYEVKMVNLSLEMRGRFVRIHPKTWHNHICMRVELIGCQECGFALGMENWKIPHRSVYTSSFQSSYPPLRARLNVDFGNNGFCTREAAVGNFLRIDLGSALKMISGVAVQGRGSHSYYVTEFALWYSRDGIYHVPYLQDGKEKVLQGSIGMHDIRKHHLNYTITARSVKIIVRTYRNLLCFRVELYGCDGCAKSGCSKVLSGYTLAASTERAGHSADKAEVSVTDSAWCATTADSSPYLQATFADITVISQIITMGHPVTGEYVKIYKITYSEDGSTWFDYKQDKSENENADATKDINRGASKMEAYVHELQYPVKAKHLKILITKTIGELCLKVAFYGHVQACKADLGLEEHYIPDSALTASSSLSVNHSPAYARLNRHLGHGAWCSNVQTAGEYLQVDLGIPHRIKGLALQAKLKSVKDSEAWVTGFTLKYSLDGSLWSDYTVNSAIKSFSGITNEHETLIINLNPSFVGRFVRIVVSSWQNRICLRLELYGCKACAEPLGLADFKIPDSSMTSPTSSTAHLARLTLFRTKIERPNVYSSRPFVQVDLGSQKHVTGVATSGLRSTLIQEYTIEYSVDGVNWSNYTENSVTKVFSGAAEGHIVGYYFTQTITCQHVRLIAEKWLHNIGIATEFFGCNA